MLVRLRICTIPLAFRRVSVCVCLVGFASLQSLWAHTFKASLPCLPLPLHQILTFPQPLQKDNNPLPRTMFLPPLSKVRCCHPKKFGRLPEGLLPIRTINEIFRTISRKVPTSLPINERSVDFVFALSHPLFVGEELAPPVAPNTAIPTTIAK